MRQILKFSLLPAALYLLFCAASGAYVYYRSEFAPVNNEFTAFGLVLLTLPWSAYLEPILSRGPDGTTFKVIVRFVLYSLANAALIYAAFALLIRLAVMNSKNAT